MHTQVHSASHFAMSYTSFTTWENRDEWPEPPKGYYYMPPEEDIIKLREVNGEILNDPHKPPHDFYLYLRIIQDPQRRCFQGKPGELPSVGERCSFYLNSDQQPFRLRALVRSSERLVSEDGGAEAKVVAVGVMEQLASQIGKNTLPFRGDDVYKLNLEYVTIENFEGNEEKVWTIVDIQVATPEERGGKNFHAHGWLMEHMPDIGKNMAPEQRNRTW